jgi:D-3-phosphoglycerate dehydrogenase
MPDGLPTVVVAGVTFPSLEIERGALEPLGYTVTDTRGLPDEEVLEACRHASGILVDYFRCNAERIAAFERCRIICQYGVGLDAIDIDAATRAGIVVTHTPEYCVDELADHTMALVLASARRLGRLDRSVHAGVWDYNVGMPIHRLAGSTFGLIGLGRVGKAVASRAIGFGMRLVAFDAYAPDKAFATSAIERVELAQLLQESAVITIHVPLTEETHHMIGSEQLALVKPGAILINTSRGGVVDQQALIEAVRSGQLAGAGLDVLEHEPPGKDEPLLSLDDVIVTPHAGFLSVESLRSVQEQAADEVARALSGSRPRFAVNLKDIGVTTQPVSIREA